VARGDAGGDVGFHVDRKGAGRLVQRLFLSGAGNDFIATGYRANMSSGQILSKRFNKIASPAKAEAQLGDLRYWTPAFAGEDASEDEIARFQLRR